MRKNVCVLEHGVPFCAPDLFCKLFVQCFLGSQSPLGLNMQAMFIFDPDMSGYLSCLARLGSRC